MQRSPQVICILDDLVILLLLIYNHGQRVALDLSGGGIVLLVLVGFVSWLPSMIAQCGRHRRCSLLGCCRTRP
jgi:hypothetical protein